jgi:hypothetical protein
MLVGIAINIAGIDPHVRGHAYGHLMADEGWQRRFDEPIETPDSKQLCTLPPTRRSIYATD